MNNTRRGKQHNKATGSTTPEPNKKKPTSLEIYIAHYGILAIIVYILVIAFCVAHNTSLLIKMDGKLDAVTEKLNVIAGE